MAIIFLPDSVAGSSNPFKDDTPVAASTPVKLTRALGSTLAISFIVPESVEFIF